MSSPKRLSFRDLVRSPANFFGMGFGAGLSPVWPGTCGALVGAAIAVPVSALPTIVQMAMVALSFGVGSPICRRTDQYLGAYDHDAIVWDEVVGMLAVSLLVPAEPVWWALGFVTFRFFDIRKPWPIRLVEEKVGGGLGVMLDDAIAAGFAVVCVQLLALALHVFSQ